MDATFSWKASNRLKINPAKTDFMHWGLEWTAGLSAKYLDSRLSQAGP